MFGLKRILNIHSTFLGSGIPVWLELGGILELEADPVWKEPAKLEQRG